MSKIIIVVDPDSKAHGVAIYIDGELSELSKKTTMELFTYISDVSSSIDFGEWIDVHVEDVASQNFMYQKHRTSKRKTDDSIKRRVGMCQQAQIELERVVEYLIGAERIFKHKPSKQWKSADLGKQLFERLTGWEGRSNEDTRSAAYFGWLGVTGK